MINFTPLASHGSDDDGGRFYFFQYHGRASRRDAATTTMTGLRRGQNKKKKQQKILLLLLLLLLSMSTDAFQFINRVILPVVSAPRIYNTLYIFFLRPERIKSATYIIWYSPDIMIFIFFYSFIYIPNIYFRTATTMTTTTTTTTIFHARTPRFTVQRSRRKSNTAVSTATVMLFFLLSILPSAKGRPHRTSFCLHRRLVTVPLGRV